jgi:phenylacetate-CoA ligase
VAQVFQSPGPIYEPGGVRHDWWRLARFLHACGIGRGDIVQNCFSYHLVPAGMMFDNAGAGGGGRGAARRHRPDRIAGARSRDIGVHRLCRHAGLPEVILDKADEMGVALRITRAAVGGGALFPSLRKEYADRGIPACNAMPPPIWATSPMNPMRMEGMIVDEGRDRRNRRPGTGDPVPPGEVGEVVVTTLNPDYPLIRFATGDLSR